MIRFGPFALDVDCGRLLRKGVPVPLPEQAFRVLCRLVVTPGELVTRDELARTLWPDGTHVDEAHGLNFCISRIRRALGDDARRSAYVETLPGRGYRFIAAVSSRASQPAALDLVRAAEPRAERRRERRLGVALAAACAAGLALLAASSAPQLSGPLAGPRDPQARVAYARGLYQSRLAGGGPGSLAALTEATLREPDNAPALSALAEAWLVAVREGRISAREGMPRARDAAARAAALGDDGAAQAVLGTVALRHDWDWDAAERFLRRAVALRPEDAPARLELADLLLVQGRADEALREARRAEELDPVCPTVNGRVAGSFYAARRYAEAAEAWRASAGVAPDGIGAHEKLFHAYRHAARPLDALREAGRVMEMAGLTAGPGFLDPSRSERGVRDFLSGTLDYLQADAARRPALLADRMATLSAALGRRDDALRWLDVAARERALGLPVTLATDPDLDALRGDAAFRALMRRLRLA